jgi:putative addiction module killer protein
MYQVVETEDYIKWFERLNTKEQAQIHARIAKIRVHGHFGIAKRLDQSLAELKWKNGRRVYFTLAQDDDGNIIVLLLGGNKNTQSKDIAKAQKLLKKLSV